MSSAEPERPISAPEAGFLTYVLYILTPVMAGTALLGYALARKHECHAPLWLRSHLKGQRRLFWLCFALLALGCLTTAIWVGWAVILLTAGFWLFRCVQGLRLCLSQDPWSDDDGARRHRVPDYQAKTDYWDPDDAPALLHSLRLIGVIESWHDLRAWVRRSRAELPTRLLGSEFDPVTAPAAARPIDRLLWEVCEIWQDAAVFVWLFAVLGTLAWVLALVASPVQFFALGWVAAFVFGRIGLSIGLIIGAYAGMGWRILWARHKGIELDETVAATPASLALLALFGALGVYIAIAVA